MPASTPASARCRSPCWCCARGRRTRSVKPWDALGTPTWPALAQEFRLGRDLQLMDKTHMMPMEDPGLVARLISDAMAEVGG